MKRMGLVLMCLCLSLCAGAQASDAVVYSNDFQGTIGPEWSNRTTEITPVGARRFLGQFRSNTVTLALSQLQQHTALTVSLDLFMIESVDGNTVHNWVGGVVGPDIWDLAIDDTSVLHTTFSNVTDVPQHQAYPGTYPGGDYPAKTGAVEVNTLGYTAENRKWGDAVYHLTYTVSHSAASASVRFLGDFQDVYSAPEGWGIDNVVVSVTPVPEPAAPKVTCFVQHPALWPPDHKLANVGLAVTALDYASTPLPTTIQVFSNENDGAAASIAADTLQLRAERTGKNGRMYLIVAQATDSLGSSGFASCTVVVPHDASARSLNTVNALAADAKAFCDSHNGAAPAGYFLIGNGSM